MKASRRAFSLIEEFEGYSPAAYRCPGGVVTIGYGHTKTAKLGQVINHDTALKLLFDDVLKTEKIITNLLKVSLNQNQFDSLVSFVFNVGPGAFRKSSLLKLINFGAFESAKLEFTRWVFSGGKVLQGLKRRRNAEAYLFATPSTDFY